MLEQLLLADVAVVDELASRCAGAPRSGVAAMLGQNFQASLHPSSMYQAAIADQDKFGLGKYAGFAGDVGDDGTGRARAWGKSPVIAREA